MEVRKSQHKYIVGPRGVVLQDILHSTGVWVEVPALDCDSATITLRGPQEKLGQALTQVQTNPSGGIFPVISLLMLSLFRSNTV